MIAARRRQPSRRRRSVLRLYVAGTSPNSTEAIANLAEIEKRLPDVTLELEIIDVFRFPARGLADSILVTPTLVRISPRPSIRIVGNLRDLELVMRSLGLP